jgi:RNA polymerase sigma-70 factor (ECF subfamily)
MTEDRTGPTDQPAGGVQFAPTQWSIVLGARGDSATRGPALQRLCSAYWLPIYGYLRRRGHNTTDAEDLTQSFFAYLLESDFLDRPDAAKGRFRGYLIGALKHFLSGHFEREKAQKRGGGVQFVDWGSVDPERELGTIEPTQAQADPGQAFDASWAMVLFQTAFRRLAEEQTAAGKGTAFAKLKGYLSAAPAPGDYERLARELGLTRSHVAVTVHRLNARYRELILLEISATVQDPHDVQDEIRHLLRVLGR